MKVRFSKLALAELDVILNDIRAENPHVATRFEERIQRVFKRIAQFPEGAQQVEDRPGTANFLKHADRDAEEHLPWTRLRTSIS